MLFTILGILFALGVYWVLWKIYISVAPSILPADTHKFLIQPKFWQFAIALFVALFLLKKMST